MPIISNFPQSEVSKHNVSDTAHMDIRASINSLIVMLMNGTVETSLETNTGELLCTTTGVDIVAYRPMT